MTDHLLPPFPTDTVTLDMLVLALNGNSEHSTVTDFLIFMSQMGGSDTDAVESIERVAGLTGLAEDLVADDDGAIEIHHMRDPQYHEHDVIRALIGEIRRLRLTDDTLSHDLGLPCSCYIVTPGDWETPPEYEQNPWCMRHPDMRYIVSATRGVRDHYTSPAFSWDLAHSAYGRAILTDLDHVLQGQRGPDTPYSL